MDADFSVFLLLLNNISIFIVLVVGYSFLIDVMKGWPAISRQSLLGLFFGLVAIGSMHVKIPVTEGVIVDQRNALIVLSGAFGGPFSAIASAVLAGAFRAYLGGAGVLAGLFGLTLSAAVGAGLYFMRWYKTDVTTLAIGAFLGVALTAPGFLLVGDLAHGWDLMNRMLLPWGSAIFTGIFLGGLLLSREDRRLRAEDEKRQSEALFETLFESSMVSLWNEDFSKLWERLQILRRSGVTDLRAYFRDHPGLIEELAGLVTVTHVNKATLSLYGAGSKEELIRSRSAIFGPHRLDACSDQICAIWDRADSFRQEAKHRSLDGRDLSVVVSMPIPASAVDFSAIPVSIMDVTDRMAAEHDRDQALQQARDANKAKSEFLAAMSHELRTPLNAILGFSEILSTQILGPPEKGQYREYAGHIYSSGALLLALVNDILDIAAIEAGRKDLTLDDFDLAGIVDESLAMLGHKAQSAEIAIQKKLPPNLAPVYGDKRAVQQVLLNLLSNSVKYTPDGGSITVAAKSSENGVEIIVADTGRGIPPDRLVDILNPFVRGESDPHRAQDGWGLGLSIAKSLVELHHGEFHIASTPGQGTTVRFGLPGRPH